MKKDVIVVFGGSFNPPTNSHFFFAEQFEDKIERVSKVILVPVNQCYNKRGLIENEHRYNMLNEVCKNNFKLLVSRIEIDDNKQLPTIETLEKLKEEYKDYEIWFATGTDNIREFNTWERAEELLENYKIIVLERDEDELDKIIEESDLLYENRNSIIRLKNSLRTNVSSTFIREKIRSGESIKYLVPEEVNSYIQENELYREE